MYEGFIKRLIDIIASFTVILLLSPVYVIIALIIYIQDKGNPIFKQFRVGKNEVEFKVFKFRSMPVNTPNVQSKDTAQLKITPFGKFIRRVNLDELPQLFNILKGDMSLIGPRPTLPSQIELNELRRHKNVFKCRPGLTGLAQVKAYDGMPDEVRAYWDGLYTEKITFVKDVSIVLKTLIYLTKKPPVY